METACEDISAFNVTLVFSAGWSDTHGDIPSENRTSASSDQDSTITESVGWDPHPVSMPRLMTSAGLARRCQFPGTIATQQGLLAAEIRPRDIPGGGVLPMWWVIHMCRGFDPLFSLWQDRARSLWGIFLIHQQQSYLLGYKNYQFLQKSIFLAPNSIFSSIFLGPIFSGQRHTPISFQAEYPPRGDITPWLWYRINLRSHISPGVSVTQSTALPCTLVYTTSALQFTVCTAVPSISRNLQFGSAQTLGFPVYLGDRDEWWCQPAFFSTWHSKDSGTPVGHMRYPGVVSTPLRFPAPIRPHQGVQWTPTCMAQLVPSVAVGPTYHGLNN